MFARVECCFSCFTSVNHKKYTITLKETCQFLSSELVLLTRKIVIDDNELKCVGMTDIGKNSISCILNTNFFNISGCDVIKNIKTNLF